MTSLTKKILSAFLIAAAAVNPILTSGCFAEDGDEWKNNTGEINLDNMTVTGSGVSVEANTVKITDGGDFNVSGTLADGMIYINSEEKVKLRLSGANISNSSGPAIFFDNAEKAFITITEGTQNSLSDGKSYTVEDADGTLFSNDDLEIKGGGVLNITGNYQHGIAGDDDVSIENGTITVNSYEHGIKANDKLSVSGGNITVTSETGKGMKADLDVVIDGGTLNITSKQSEGIESKGTLTINGGDINVTAADDGINTGNADSGTEQTDAFAQRGEKPFMADGERGARGDMQTPPDGMTQMTPPDGMTQMAPPDDMAQMMPPDRTNHVGHMNDGAVPDGSMPQGGGHGMGGMMMDEETAAAHAITINGGSIHVNAEGDGIDSNGSLSINGGTVTVYGPSNTGNGPLDAEAGINMNGGTVMTASSAGMLQLPTAADGINILSASFDGAQNAGTTVSIKETASGNELMTMTPTKSFQAVVFASSELKSGTDYTIYLNGSQYTSFTASAGTTTVGNAAFGGRGMGGRNGGNWRGDPASVRRDDEIKVFVNGNRVTFNTAPVLKNDTTLVGFRAILEALGAEVSWDEATQTVTAVGNGVTITLTINSTKADVNGKTYELLAAPEIINDSTLVPVRFLSEQLGMTVNWDDATETVTINS